MMDDSGQIPYDAKCVAMIIRFHVRKAPDNVVPKEIF